MCCLANILYKARSHCSQILLVVGHANVKIDMRRYSIALKSFAVANLYHWQWQALQWTGWAWMSHVHATEASSSHDFELPIAFQLHWFLDGMGYFFNTCLMAPRDIYSWKFHTIFFSSFPAYLGHQSENNTVQFMSSVVLYPHAACF